MPSTYYGHEYNDLTVIKGVRKWLMVWGHKAASVEKLLRWWRLQLPACSGHLRWYAFCGTDPRVLPALDNEPVHKAWSAHRTLVTAATAGLLVP